MGIDLRLLPCEHWTDHDGRVWGYAHTILDWGRVDIDALNAFNKTVKPYLVAMPVNHHITSFVGARVPDGYHEGEAIYGTIREKDAYGEAYKFVAAQHLLPWLVEYFQYDGHAGHGPYQASIVAYVRALPADTKIVLDWH